MILADSNVLIDVISDDPKWAAWSLSQIEIYGRNGQLVVNQIVIAEVAPRFGSIDAFRTEVEILGVTLLNFGAPAAFAAGAAFTFYRRNRGKGAPRLALPDFFIGGHALVDNATILTRDPRFYRTYFPSVPLITPETTEP